MLARWAGTRGTSIYAIDWLGMVAPLAFRFSSLREARRFPGLRVRSQVFLRRVARGVACGAGEDHTHRALARCIRQCRLCAAISEARGLPDLALPHRCPLQPE
jgi:hypothetical protein